MGASIVSDTHQGSLKRSEWLPLIAEQEHSHKTVSKTAKSSKFEMYDCTAARKLPDRTFTNPESACTDTHDTACHDSMCKQFAIPQDSIDGVP